MSFLTYRTPVLRAVLSSSPVCIAGSRSLSVSSTRFALSEGEVNHENRGPEIDKHKAESIKNQKEGNAKWKRELASQSEAAVKADREEVDASADTIKNLQKETEEFGKKTH